MWCTIPSTNTKTSDSTPYSQFLPIFVPYLSTWVFNQLPNMDQTMKKKMEQEFVILFDF